MPLKNIFVQFWKNSWWVLAFVIICTIFYEHGLQKQDFLFRHLMEQLKDSQKEKEKLLIHQESLQLQIKSHADKDWIELTLIKEMGLVPEGYQKVYFYPQNTLEHTID